MFRLGTVLVFTLAATLTAAETPLAQYERVVVQPTKTSIYVGTVSLTMSPFLRKNGGYTTSYVAKVFPFVFYNEAGALQVDVSDAMLRALERGEAIEFKGRAVRDDGAERLVEGKATPAEASGGKLKVRVFISKRIELIFNTTYQFEAPPAR